MKETIYWLAKYCGIFALCRWLTRKNLRILCYHGIWLGGDRHFGNFLYMSPDKFSHRMDLLASLGYPVIDFDEALLQLQAGTLASGTTAITIDDGWYGTYKHMLPALEKHKLPATLYVTTWYSERQRPVFNVALHYLVSRSQADTIDLGTLGEPGGKTLALGNDEERSRTLQRLQELADAKDIDNRAEFVARIARALQVDWQAPNQERWFHLMSPAEVEDAAKRGLDIQLHTHRHRTSVSGTSTLAAELADNRSALARSVPGELPHFCYPSGIYQPGDWPALEASRVKSATTTEAGLASRGSHPYALPRLLDGQEVSDLEFEAEISGFGEIKRRILGQTPKHA